MARVLPLLRVAHLDREFDYRIPQELHESVQVGSLVRIRFRGKLEDGVVLSRTQESEFDQGGSGRKLAWIERVTGAVPMMTPQVLDLVEAVAVRYGGSRPDVIRTAVPSRHAGGEEAACQAAAKDPEAGPGQAADGYADGDVDLSGWGKYSHGQSFVQAAAAGRARAVWQIAPGEQWPVRLAELAALTVVKGGGVIIVVPDGRDVEQVAQACRQLVGDEVVVELTAAAGRFARWRRWCEVMMGRARVVVGTRAAAFAPVKDLRVAVVVDDGNEGLIEPRAPYYHAREVVTLRSAQEGCSAVVAGWGRTAEAQLLVESGWAGQVVAMREVIRAGMPRVRAIEDTDYMLRDRFARSRLPGVAFEAVRQALDEDRAALLVVPRKGYVPTLACTNCGTPVRCRYCHGPVEIPAGPQGGDQQEAALPRCRWCGREVGRFECAECGHHRLRAVVVGTDRTREEIGRAFPGVPIDVSTGDARIDWLRPGRRIVLSTPGAYPYPVGDVRYGAAVILDTWTFLLRADVRAHEQALAQWLQVVAQVDPAGQVVVVAESDNPVVQQVIRWDPVGAAQVELEGRRQARFSPAVHMAAIDGQPQAVRVFREFVELPVGAEVLGPVPLPPGVALPAGVEPGEECVRLIVRGPVGMRASTLGRALRQARIQAGLHRAELPVRVVVDPVRIG